METGSDGFRGCITSKHMTFQNSGISVSRYISKISVQTKFRRTSERGAFTTMSTELGAGVSEATEYAAVKKINKCQQPPQVEEQLYGCEELISE